jgi:RNA polymerase sigma-70 factor, ECF subfamily
VSYPLIKKKSHGRMKPNMDINNQSSITDNEVILKVSSGEVEYFSILYERYVTRIYNYIYYRTGNQFEAEDLTERVFYRALGRIGSYKNMGVPFSAWLYRIAHNLVANWHRDNSRRHEVPLEDFGQNIGHDEHPESSLITNMENEELIKTLRQLPAERQQLIILKFVEDLSNAEIAIIMGRSEGAIKSLYHRTLLALRKETDSEEN